MVEARDGWAVFHFFRPRAGQVHVAGDFNGWEREELPMRRDGGGYWKAALRLPTGSYRFRYFADGQWFCDFAAFGVVYGPFGPDSLIRIGRDSDA